MAPVEFGLEFFHALRSSGQEVGQHGQGGAGGVATGRDAEEGWCPASGGM
jgi:hypothetical protein